MPLVSRDTAAELIRVLTYPRFKLAAEQQRDLFADYLPWSGNLSHSRPAAQDPRVS